jgi:hypothetical protein
MLMTRCLISWLSPISLLSKAVRSVGLSRAKKWVDGPESLKGGMDRLAWRAKSRNLVQLPAVKVTLQPQVKVV